MGKTSWSVFLGLLAFAYASRPPPFLSAPAGDFTGHWVNSVSGLPIAAFEGIPYAYPPTGFLRFQNAVPLSTPLRDYLATRPGNACSQRPGLGTSKEVVGEEDCLYLNVYVPQEMYLWITERDLLPVIFCVHGGGFIEGSGYPYRNLNFLDKNIVLVTFNYRLGPLGFLTTEDDVIPGNLGLKDQVVALRWVRENIDAFGGNSRHITVFGYGAGGASAEFLMLSPMSKGLIWAVIAMSGSAQASWALAYPGETRRRLEKAAEEWKCPMITSMDLLACLRSKTHQEITGMDFNIPGWRDIPPRIYFKPVVEDNRLFPFLPFHPTGMYIRKIFSDIPILTGQVSDAAGSFTSLLFEDVMVMEEFNTHLPEIMKMTYSGILEFEEDPRRFDDMKRRRFELKYGSVVSEIGAAYVYSDLWFTSPMMDSINLRSKVANSPAYLYYFHYNGTATYGKKFVSHGDDLYYLMVPLLRSNETTVLNEDKYSQMMTDLLLSFANTGTPKSDLLEIEWLPVTSPESKPFLEIASPDEIIMKDNFDLLTDPYLNVRWRFVQNLTEYRKLELEHDG